MIVLATCHLVEYRHLDRGRLSHKLVVPSWNREGIVRVHQFKGVTVNQRFPGVFLPIKYLKVILQEVHSKPRLSLRNVVKNIVHTEYLGKKDFLMAHVWGRGYQLKELLFIDLIPDGHRTSRYPEAMHHPLLHIVCRTRE